MTTDLQVRVEETEGRIQRLLGDEKPSAFRPDYWSGRIIEWCLGDEDFKTRMFRFVDVLPALSSAEAAARHAREYFDGVESRLGGALKWGLRAADSSGLAARALSRGVESQVRSLAGQFIAGREPREALPKLVGLRRDGAAFTVSLLGEAAVSEREADDYAQRCLDALNTLSDESSRWPSLGDGGPLDWGSSPRVNLSVKPSALYSQLRPAAFERGVEEATARLRGICRTAVARGASICLDMEDRELKNLTLAVFRALLEDPEFEGWGDAGVALQVYLKETGEDLDELLAWSRRRGQPFTIRLIKGAYWDAELVHARQRNWPIPVWTDKARTDAAFEEAARKILDTAPDVRLACGSHNIHSIAFARETARTLETAPERLEFQLLFGMADPILKALLDLQFPTRVYCPVGELIPGMAYLVRRLLENTSNESFLRQRFGGGAAKKPATPPRAEIAQALRPSPGAFANEPFFDWTLGDVRARFGRALREVRDEFPVRVGPVIAGREQPTEEEFESRNPNRVAEVVARVSAANGEMAREAVAAAAEAFPRWRDAGVEERSAVLRRAAGEARERRHHLAALQVFEAGKAWDEADADVCEAIDFLEYYAREMERLTVPQKMGDAPGEDSRLFYEPRGVAAVIAPWNFPLAISMGMTSAALVAGNTVVYKPSSETVAIGREMTRIFERAGLPAGVLSFLPGSGGEVGAALVGDSEVRLIAFTGSREVGLEIVRRAADVAPGSRWIKHVIAEMGGKNAIIVDDDADLDEAVVGVVRSAFGYQGQKCSACSRVIVLESARERFLERLAGAVESLPLGPVEDPANFAGAVISDSARRKIEEYVELGRRELTTVVARRPDAEGGHFPSYAVFADVPPGHRLAQEEIFGPVLAVIAAADFDQAIEIALDSDYALTGAVYSRSPENIAKARESFRVGNLYINRGSTQAIVGRHPFGGFKLSGLGSKTGGPDYLRQFVIPRLVAENTTRRGFTPGIG